MRTDPFILTIRIILFVVGALIFYWAGTATQTDLIEATARAFPVYVACQLWNAAATQLRK